MTVRSQLTRLLEQENINFLLTNRIPRRLLTRLVGRLSKIEQPLVRRVCIGLWRFFSDLDLSDAETTRFKSMHDCFTRRLRPGARPIDADPAVVVSPCDGIVGAFGPISGTELFQIKGSPYTLAELLADEETARQHRDGVFATLRLTSGMYHRFHAPHDCAVGEVVHIAGDTWNVNPVALKRVERLFCKNERVVVRTALAGGESVTLVAVGAILVASVRLHFLDLTFRAGKPGSRRIGCDARLRKGEEMGWFEHGSTIVVLAPRGFRFAANIQAGAKVRVGEPLLVIPPRARNEASSGAAIVIEASSSHGTMAT